MIILPTPTQISVMHVVEIGSGWSVATFCTLSTLNFGIDSHVCTIPVLEQSDTMSGKRDLEIFLGNNNDPFYTWALCLRHTTDSEEEIIKIETLLKQAVALTGGRTGCNFWLYTRPRLTAGAPWKLTRTSKDSGLLRHMVIVGLWRTPDEANNSNMSHTWIYEFRPTL